MKLTTTMAAAFAGSALAGQSSAPKHKAPSELLTGCPNGFTDFVTGECKPYHLRIRDAMTGQWQSHKVNDAYNVHDGPGPDRDHKNGGPKQGGKKQGQFGHGFPGGPSEHCPNGVAFHATGECKPFRVHARDADSGEWREHHATGAYKIPDERPGQGGRGPMGNAHFGGDHDGPKGGKQGAGNMKGGPGGKGGGRGGW